MRLSGKEIKSKVKKGKENSNGKGKKGGQIKFVFLPFFVLLVVVRICGRQLRQLRQSQLACFLLPPAFFSQC